MALKKGREIPTIDVVLVTISVAGVEDEIAINTASKIAVSPQTETEDAVKLIIKGALIAQKPTTTTLTGNTITLTDNVFIPELMTVLQGGIIKYYADDAGESESDTDMGYGVKSYTPPVAGSSEKGKPFTLNAYAAIYNAAGIIEGYEKISYPNCQGTPVSVSSEDNVFRVSEYTINSAPKTGEAPYIITYPKKLPEVLAAPLKKVASVQIDGMKTLETGGSLPTLTITSAGVDAVFSWKKDSSPVMNPSSHSISSGSYELTVAITAQAGYELEEEITANQLDGQSGSYSDGTITYTFTVIQEDKTWI